MISKSKPQLLLRRLAAVLTVVAVLCTGGAAIAEQEATQPGTSLQRIGTVLADPPPTATHVSVQITAGGEAHRMPYHAPYVPVAGDKVTIQFAAPGVNMSGVVLGGRSGQSGNLVVNGSFQRAPQLLFPPTNSPPYLWTRYEASGTPAAVSQVPHNSFQRLFMGFYVTGLNSGDTYAYNAAIPVTAGETLKFNMLGRIVVFASTSVTVTTRVGWFASEAAVYPAFVSETVLGTDTTAVDANLYHTNSAVVPAGITHARVAIRAQHTGSAAGSGFTLYVAEVAAHR